jgi:general L-amino acid transport system substrate-binding protein
MDKIALGVVGLVVGAGAAYFVIPPKTIEVEKIVEKTVAADTKTGRILNKVKSKGFVQCGVSQGVPGFSNPDAQGGWSGLDVDVCRAVAAALFSDSTKVKYTPLSSKERFTALQSGEIDMLSRNTTWTLTRDTALGMNFAGVAYYDGQGFMVRKKMGIKSALELDGASVCTNLGTTTELNLSDYFRANNMKFKAVFFEKADEVIAAYDAGRCDVYTTDQSALAAQRTKLKDPTEHQVLPEIISKEPLGPVVPHADDQWFDLVKWSLNAMIEAEELGINSGNVDKMKADSTNPAIRRMLGVEGDTGKNLGLGNDWSYNIIKQVGNYAEVFDRHLGENTPVGLPRGLNRLWNKGGILYAPPVR